MTSSTKESTVKESTVRKSQDETDMRRELRAETTRSAFEHFHEYGRERPGVVALWCVGIGFVLGWKLKPW